MQGLFEKSRSQSNHPNKTKDYLEAAIVALRQTHGSWGAEKIWSLLHRQYRNSEVSSISTINRVLKRNDLAVPRKRQRRVKPVFPIFDPNKCNEVWSADFEGKFRMGNKLYCHLITIADSYSRFVVIAKGLYGEIQEPTKKEFERVFRAYGLPKQIHTDNGKPFWMVQAYSAADASGSLVY